MTEIKLEEITPEEMAIFRKVMKLLGSRGGGKGWKNMTDEQKEAYRKSQSELLKRAILKKKGNK